MKTIILLFAVLLMGACGGRPSQYTFTAEPTMSEGDLEMIADAVHQWNTCRVVPINFVIGGSGGIIVERVSADDPRIWRAGEGFVVLGTTPMDGEGVAHHVLFVESELIRTVLLHEIGHALGLGHSETGIMRAGIDRGNPQLELTSEDCAALAK